LRKRLFREGETDIMTSDGGPPGRGSVFLWKDEVHDQDDWVADMLDGARLYTGRGPRRRDR